VKIFISTDMEGSAGIVDWAQCSGEGWEAVAGRKLLLDEVNAAIDGALAGGATEIVVNDSHSVMRNLPGEQLHGRASYISGRHKPRYMMQGLDASFDAVFFVSYHGSVGAAAAVLPHTYNPRAVAEVRINGTVVGESGVNALVAAHFGVPIVLITGDQTACAEAAAVLPGIRTAVVKQSITRSAAASLHPELACELIEHEARAAVTGLAAAVPPPVARPATLEITWRTADMAAQAAWVRGMERAGDRVTTSVGEDLLELFGAFIASVVLNRDLTADL
jgi:D-amino peptidase